MHQYEAGNAATPASAYCRVRQAATGTAIGAALLLFFGFVHLGRPMGTDLFNHAWLVVYYALRIGGVASAAIALWLWTGRRPALIVDAVVAVLLGAIFVLSGLAMLFDGGGAFESAIITICGGTFVSSGLRNWRVFFQMSGPPRRPTTVVPPTLKTQAFRSEPPSPARTSPSKENVHTPGGLPTARSSNKLETPAEPSTEGFPASFAKKKPPP